MHKAGKNSIIIAIRPGSSFNPPKKITMVDGIKMLAVTRKMATGWAG
jgi:hypothetical protein